MTWFSWLDTKSESYELVGRRKVEYSILVEILDNHKHGTKFKYLKKLRTRGQLDKGRNIPYAFYLIPIPYTYTF